MSKLFWPSFFVASALIILLASSVPLLLSLPQIIKSRKAFKKLKKLNFAEVTGIRTNLNALGCDLTLEKNDDAFKRCAELGKGLFRTITYKYANYDSPYSTKFLDAKCKTGKYIMFYIGEQMKEIDFFCLDETTNLFFASSGKRFFAIESEQMLAIADYLLTKAA